MVEAELVQVDADDNVPAIEFRHEGVVLRRMRAVGRFYFSDGIGCVVMYRKPTWFHRLMALWLLGWTFKEYT